MKKLILQTAAVLAVIQLSPLSLMAQWNGATSGTGAADANRNYNSTANWDSATIDDTFTGDVVTGANTVYFSGDRTTTGAVGVLETGLGPFGTESLLLGADGLALGYTNAANSLTLTGGSTVSGPATAHTLTLSGDLVYQTGTKGVAGAGALTFGSGVNGLTLDLGSEARKIYAGFQNNTSSNNFARAIIFSNNITGSGDLIKAGQGLIRIGAGTDFTGSTIIGYGAPAPTVSGIINGIEVRELGSLVGSTNIQVQNGNTLLLNNGNQVQPVTQHLNAATDLSLSKGSLIHQYNHTSTAKDYDETVATLNLLESANVLRQGVTGSTPTNLGTTELTIGSLNRYNNSVLYADKVIFTADAVGNPNLGQAGNNVFITNVNGAAIAGSLIGGGGAAGSTNQSILPFVYGADVKVVNAGPAATLMTYDATNGLRPLDRTTEFATDINTSAADDNVLVGTTNLGGSKTANAVLLTDPTSAGSTLDLDGNTLTVTSGVVAGATGFANSNLVDGTINFGTREGMLSMLSSRIMNVFTTLTGSGGVTLSGGGANSFFLNQNNSGLTGKATLAGNTATTTVYLQHSNALGSGGNALEMHSGVTASFGLSSTVRSQFASLSGGSYFQPATVLVVDGADSFGIGAEALAGTILMDGGSAFISPGLAQGSSDYAKVGRLDLNSTSASFLNGDIRFDLMGAPVTAGSLAESMNDLILVQNALDLSNGGMLSLSINSLGSFTPSVGESWTVLVAGGDAGVNTIVDGNGGLLFDTVSSGFAVTIGDYGTGTNNALIVTAVPEPASAALMLLGGLALLAVHRARRRQQH